MPLAALCAATVSAIALAAQAGLSFCNARVAIPLPAAPMTSMPGMDMGSMADMPGMVTLPAGHALMICPVVLVLIVASGLLAAAAIAVAWRDPHRALARRKLVRALAAAPPLRTTSAFAVLGAGALAAMVTVDGAGPPPLATCALLAVLLAGCSLAAGLISVAVGRLALALGRRLMLVVVAAVARAAQPAPPLVAACAPAGFARPVSSPLARGRGLRAPPPVLR